MPSSFVRPEAQTMPLRPARLLGLLDDRQLQERAPEPDAAGEAMSHLVPDDDAGRHPARPLPVGVRLQRGDVVAGRPDEAVDRVVDVLFRARHEVVLVDAQDVVELVEHLQQEHVEAREVVPPEPLVAGADVQPSCGARFSASGYDVSWIAAIRVRICGMSIPRRSSFSPRAMWQSWHDLARGSACRSRSRIRC
jgi:hypothetical protein